jgi:hypothetical protein
MITRCTLVAAGAASLLLLSTTLSAQANDVAAASSGVSKVRIVRLSEVKGQVQLDRNNGRGFEPGITNLPIVENSKLKTGEGVAEIEFEDNSSLRVAPDSIVEFPQLERMATGGTASTVHLVQGMAYVSLVKSNNNQFNLMFGDQNLPLPAPSHIRLQLSGTEARLAVLDGNLHVAQSSGLMLDIPKKRTATFDLLQHQQPTVAKDILPEPYDEWDHNSVDYHARVANVSSFNGSPYSYGMNDMSYYGSFADSCGMGMMWRPYFASAAWDPYANGAWAYYQGAGYSWVSPYPWGWMPYHSGSWAFCAGTGWGWMPGGNWNGLNNFAMIPQSGGGSGTITKHPPIQPIRPPGKGEPTMYAVNTKPVVRSGLSKSDSFEFRKDSAGLGVPRDAFGKLEKYSSHVQAHGIANEHVYFSAPANTMPGGQQPMRGGQPNMRAGQPTSTAVMGQMHRGSPPPAAPMGGFSGGNPGGNMGPRGGGPSQGPVMSAPSAPSAPHASAPSSSGGARSH